MREPAWNRREARARYLRILRRTTSCVSSNAQLYVGPAPRQDGLLSLNTDPEPIGLRTQAGSALALQIQQLVRFVDDADFAGEVRLTTEAYAYSVHATAEIESAPALVYWHWSPATDGRGPHVHAPVGDPAGRRMRLHLPTGRRVSIEQVVEHLIEEWGVVPARVDWRSVLQDSRDRFETYRRQD